MSIANVEQSVLEVFNDFSSETFIYQLLAAYGKPKASISRLQKGTLNLSKQPGEIIWKKNLLFRAVKTHSKNPYPGLVSEAPANELDLHIVADQLRKSHYVSKHALRFVIVTDYETLLAIDTKTTETLDIPLKELPKHFDFFLPWAGHEKHKTHNESQADIKAAEKMGKLYDQICKDNPGMDAVGMHSLNVFLSRLLFCFFAEDTEIFPIQGMFTSAITSHTQQDGSDLHSYLDRLFEALNSKDRLHYPAYLQAFPYVNGGLFSLLLKAPKFSRYSRSLIIECGALDWSEINPDIFGSMMQAVMQKEHRGEIGMHYTSVSNIMKVIEPLFLNELREALEENQDSPKGLEKLLQRLYTIKVFDPACGSGNFLVIAYKELRKLEMQIYERLRDIHKKGALFLPRMALTQFSGIELDDFAHEIAILSMWLAEHQMNVKFKEKLGQVVPPLPLKKSGNIVCANATRIDWEIVCPKDQTAEIFILGNPPYLGSSNQDDVQKTDMAIVFDGIQNYKNLDYIACWFFKAAQYIQGANAKSAFVSTNSICQGEQVEMLWPHVFGKDLEIGFAHQSFKWSNSAKHNAGVTVVIVGIRNRLQGKKALISDKTIRLVDNINPYLASGKTIFIQKQSAPISTCLSEMICGSKPTDGGGLILSDEDRDKILNVHPTANKFIKKLIGTSEFVGSSHRWCIWVESSDHLEASKIGPILERFDQVKKFRLSSKKPPTKKLATVPFQFGEVRHRNTVAFIVPEVSSERREYVPIGFINPDTVITNKLFAIYEADPYIFAIISSKMHNVWVRAVAGRLEERISYSSVLCYNTFPIPELTPKQKEALSTHVFNVLAEREKHPEKTIAQLYDPDKMPSGLLQAHRDMDVAVERCYRSKPFISDDERLEYLFEMYEKVKQTGEKEKTRA